MIFKDSISFILDNPRKHDEEAYAESREFCHSFGLKCDYVGWSKLVLDDAGLEILRQMHERAKELGGEIRCMFWRELEGDYSFEWYELQPMDSLEWGDDKWHEEADPKKDTDLIPYIRAYKVLPSEHLIGLTNSRLAVRQSFVKAYEEHQLTGLRFAWVRDIGRYEAEPFYQMIFDQRVLRMTSDYGLPDHTKRALMGEAGQLVGEIQQVFLPTMVDPAGMPDSDFAYGYLRERSYGSWFIKRSAAELLMEKGVLSRHELRTAPYFDEERDRMVIKETAEAVPFSQENIEIAEKEYQRFAKKIRPKYIVNEKKALTQLRRAKRREPEDFYKPLKKADAEELEQTALALLIPYYRISDGGYFSDIAFASADEVRQLTDDFFSEWELEERLQEDFAAYLSCLVIAACDNGDSILLHENGKVIRFDHEDPYLSKHWDTLAQFFYENLDN